MRFDFNSKKTLSVNSAAGGEGEASLQVLIFLALAMDVRQKSKADLLSQLKDLKAELKVLRVAQATGRSRDQLSKIQLVNISMSHVCTDLAKAEEEEAFDSRFTHQASLKAG